MKKSFIILLAILFGALILRTFNLDKVPPSLFGDEVDVGYQAYSLLKTGQDLQANSWPALIQSLAEYRAPLYIYSTVPFVGIFGLNEWGVRLPAVFWGMLGILGIYFLTKKLFNEKIALLSSFFLAISPWHIHYSRASFEVTMLLSFLIFATLFFIKGFEKKYFLTFAAALFGLVPYIYSTGVVFMPLLMLILLFFFKNKLKKNIKIVIFSFLIMFLSLIPYGVNTFSGKTGERFAMISIFGNKDLQEKVYLAQKEENLIFNLQRFFHNKPLIYGQYFTQNYLRSFSPEFLFLAGDPNSRHSIHEMGQMYVIELILLIMGIWILVKMENKWKWLVLGWLLFSPVPAALTYDGGFHSTRLFLMLPPLIILVALGFEKFKNFKVLLILFLAFNFLFFMHRYFIDYPKQAWKAWHFGFKESMQFIKNNEKNYEKIVINNSYEPSLIRFLFWTKYPPDKFHQNFTGDRTEGFNLEKYYFGKLEGTVENALYKNTLFMASARDDITNPEILKNSNIKLLKQVNSPTDEPIFYLITGQK